MGDFFLNAAVTLFVTIDPVGVAPMFLAVTLGRTPAERRRVAILAALIAGAVLIGAALIGGWLLEALGISLAAFQIAGGVLLFLIGAEMLFDVRARRRREAVEGSAGEPDEQESVAAFPLAVPLLAGPGAISAAILMSSQAPDLAGRVGLMAIIIAMVLAALAAFLLADQIERFVRPTARIVLTRLLGLILAALAVQFVADGVMMLTSG